VSNKFTCPILHVQIFNNDVNDKDKYRKQWGDDLRAACIGRLDPSVRDIRKVDNNLLQHIYDVMENDWQYVEETFSMKKSRCHCSKVMKGQRARLHKYFLANGKRMDKKPPENVKPEQWRNLCEWWMSPEGIAYIEKMTHARSKVVNPSRVGRGGYRGKEAKLVSHS
jgi:hypothetical protein